MELKKLMKKMILEAMEDGVTSLLQAEIETRDILFDNLEAAVAEIRKELS